MSIYNRAAPEQPFYIYNSPFKIVMTTLRNLFFRAPLVFCIIAPFYLIVLLKYKDINFETLATPLGVALIAAIVASIILVLWPIYTAINKFLNLAKPAVILTRQGIQFEGYPLVRWNNIKENIFQTINVNGITIRFILIYTKNDGKKNKYFVSALKIKPDEYLKQCDIYSSVSQ